MAKPPSGFLIVIVIVGGALVLGQFLPSDETRSQTTSSDYAASTEKYRLIHAIGNDETEVARDLSKRECEEMKADRIAVAEALGIHSEKLGVGSITCLPEGIFQY